jgi:hypothetical protein
MQLQEIVNRLQSDQLRKRDLIVPSSAMTMRGGNILIAGLPEFRANEMFDRLFSELDIMKNHDEEQMFDEFYRVEPNEIAHQQIGATLGIPKPYYDRMNQKGFLSLLDENVTYWLKRADSNYTVRTLAPADGVGNGILRAVLSDRFHVVDHLDLTMSALEAVKSTGLDVKFDGGDITDRRIYLRFTSPKIEVAAPELLKNYRAPNGRKPGGNSVGVISGFVIGNSETGHGRWFVAPRIVILACQNGMIRKSESVGQVHLGGKMDTGVVEWSPRTHERNLELIRSQITDAVKTYLTTDYLSGVVRHLEEVGGGTLKHPEGTIKNVSFALGFGKEKTDALVDYFMRGSDISPFGVVQAVTYFAHQDGVKPDDRFELESGSFELVEAVPKDYDKPFTEKPRIKDTRNITLN